MEIILRGARQQEHDERLRQAGTVEIRDSRQPD
jgi:hypothetical protein